MIYISKIRIILHNYLEFVKTITKHKFNKSSTVDSKISQSVDHKLGQLFDVNQHFEVFP